VSLMQEVLRSGTGAAVRSRGFTLPAAGKTGTSHDAWFAGFTSKLLCIVWVGLDDYQDIKMEGSKAALPIWTEFMKRAHEHRAYRDVTPFDVPDGVVSGQIDSGTGELATNRCPLNVVKTEYYLQGTQPVQFCATHMGGNSEIASWGESLPPAPAMGGQAPNNQVAVPPPVMRPAPNTQLAVTPPPGQEPVPDPGSQQQKDKQKEKKNLLDKLKSIFR
jgi:penicillin-binding protein 1B